jgi:multidrug efflux pump
VENISRHIEDGMPRMQAASAARGRSGFTLLSISLSLIAVFIPILLMGGILGRLFREFTVTLSIAILVSLAISLDHHADDVRAVPAIHGRRTTGGTPPGIFERLRHGYGRTLTWALQSQLSGVGGLYRHDLLNVALLYRRVPKGFFPQQDTGRLSARCKPIKASLSS